MSAQKSGQFASAFSFWGRSAALSDFRKSSQKPFRTRTHTHKHAPTQVKCMHVCITKIAMISLLCHQRMGQGIIKRVFEMHSFFLDLSVGRGQRERVTNRHLKFQPRCSNRESSQTSQKQIQTRTKKRRNIFPALCQALSPKLKLITGFSEPNKRRCPSGPKIRLPDKEFRYSEPTFFSRVNNKALTNI